MNHSSLTKRMLASSLALVFAGCSAQNAAMLPQTSTPSSAHVTLHGPASPDFRIAGPFVYVANVGGSSSSDCATINVYSLGRRPHLVRQISDGIGMPRALTLDAQSNLYVANAGGSGSSSSSGSNGSVTIYPQGTGHPAFTVTHGINNPSALAINGKGFLYVANEATSSNSSSSGNFGSVTVYRPANRKLVRTITSGIGQPIALGFDASNNLYVLNASASSSSSSSSSSGPSTPSVSVYAPGHTDPSATITTGITAPTAMAVDAAGDVIVANAPASSSHGGSGSVNVYLAGHTSPDATMSGGIADPIALDLDSAGDLFVANRAGGSSSSSGVAGSVAVFAAGSTTAARTILDGIRSPDAMTADAAGNVAVANMPGSSSSSSGSSNGASVSYYPAGSIRPADTITAHLNTPVAVGLSAH